MPHLLKALYYMSDRKICRTQNQRLKVNRLGKARQNLMVNVTDYLKRKFLFAEKKTIKQNQGHPRLTKKFKYHLFS